MFMYCTLNVQNVVIVTGYSDNGAIRTEFDRSMHFL